MKNINETVKSKYLIYILFLAGGLLLGWLLFHNSDTDSHTSQASETGTEVHAPYAWPRPPTERGRRVDLFHASPNSPRQAG